MIEKSYRACSTEGSMRKALHGSNHVACGVNPWDTGLPKVVHLETVRSYLKKTMSSRG